MPNFSELLQLGFAGAMAFVLVYLIWRLSNTVITTFKEMQIEHVTYMRDLQKEHRSEREQCYQNHAQHLDRFDQTLHMLSKNFTCHGKPRVTQENR